MLLICQKPHIRIDNTVHLWYNINHHNNCNGGNDMEQFVHADTCYNCGGEFKELRDRLVCRSCGTYKPKAITSEEAALLYSAFQKLRLAEFSEAEREFDDIIQRYPGNAQGYWGRLLSRYGIKYEEDHDGRRIPTCYSPTIESVFESQDYQKAIEYSDEENQAVFREHAEYIERVREEWQQKASKEKPYDIFICFKDSDEENGLEHTADSDELRELYFFLIKKGYRVFFSRETLTDKIGEKYEPYIYGALSTAKIMLVYASKPEYVNSTWVKNEWSRYQKRIQEGEKHPDSLLIAYKGFSPKDLPIALSSLGRQHIDAGKPEFYSDLLETVGRIMKNSYNLNTDGRIVCEHEEVIVPAKAPTCTQSGWSESSHCALCGHVLKPLEILPATGHHFGDWTVSKPATCTEDGEYERVCSCGEKEITVIPSRGGHVSSEEWEIVREPSEGREGLCAKKCIVCGEHVEEMTIPALPAMDAKPSQGLRYKVNADKETCEIVGPGTCHETDIMIPSSIDGYTVTGIAKEAFKGRDKITSVIISHSVTSIGDYAFFQCKNLTSVRIGDSVRSIGAYAFYHCHALSSLVIGESVQTIGSYAFYECKGMVNVVIPDSVTSIESQAFGFCEKLSGVVIGESVKNIGASAFRGCKNLLRVNIPSSVESIGSYAFSAGVLEFRISSGNETYAAVDGNLCSKDGTKLIQYATGKKEASFTISASVSSIDHEAFMDCKALMEITFPVTVTDVGKEVFKNCKNLSKLNYEGDKKQWKKVALHNDWKNGSSILAVSCTNGIVKLK